MRVHVDLDACESHGQCVFAAPEVFEFDDDDVITWDATPDDALREKIEQAVRLCPVEAITTDAPA
jgi:ferredoxin